MQVTKEWRLSTNNYKSSSDTYSTFLLMKNTIFGITEPNELKSFSTQFAFEVFFRTPR
jgi:hypothetical protein